MRAPPRRVLVIAAACLMATVAIPGAAMVRLAALGVLLAACAGYLLWLRSRGEWGEAVHRPASQPNEQLADVALGRVGEPVTALCPFVLRLQQTPVERWQGEESLWMATTEQWLWLLHRTPTGGVGGVKSRLSRSGLHARWSDRRLSGHHVGEFSWPADASFLIGELRGVRSQRLRLMGLLAGDELGVRELVTRRSGHV